jgi:hypothetical protein
MIQDNTISPVLDLLKAGVEHNLHNYQLRGWRKWTFRSVRFMTRTISYVSIALLLLWLLNKLFNG